MSRFRSFIPLALLALAGCGQPESQQAAAPGVPAMDAADVVFTNGKVYTVNDAQPWAEAVAIKDNKIVYVGGAAGVAEFTGEGTETIDVGGKMVLPGFVSAHDHLIGAEWPTYGVDLFPGSSKEDYLELIRVYAEANPEEEIIRGIGWGAGPYGGLPTAAELDTAVADRPVILLDFTIHDAWLNTKAMELAGVDKNTADAVPGVTYWQRDEDGNPTGAAIEFAWMPAYIALGAWDPESMIPSSHKNLYAAAVKTGMTAHLNPALVTPTVIDAEKMFEDMEYVMEYLAGLEQQGKLDLRAFIQPGFKMPDTDVAEFVAKAEDLAKRYDSDNLRAFGIKIHPEGNWTSRTSRMLEPYLPPDDTPEELDRPSVANYGAASVGPELMQEVVLAANAKGLDVVTHVDGSATVRAMIDAIEAANAAGYTKARNQLHHFFWADPADLQRTLDMNLPVNVTPAFCSSWEAQDALALELLGEERINSQYCQYPTVAANGNRLSISSDVPSSPVDMMDPLFVMEGAVTLQD
ncbi:MAG: amidohydrolase, partial [Gammaproteobacteria bacterium]